VSPTAGRLVERLDPERGIALTALGGAAVFLALALLTRSWLHLVVFMISGGVLVAFGHPAANLLLSEAMPRDRNGLAFGIKQSAVPMATLLAGSSVPALALTLGWRWAFASAAAPALILFVATLRRPRATRLRAPTGRPTPLPPLIALAVMSGFAAGAANAMAAFFVDSAVTRGFAVGLAGALLAFGGAASVTLRILLGWQADRRGDDDDLPVVIAMLLVGTIGFILIPVAPTPVFLAIAAFLAFGCGWSWNGLLVRSVVLAHPRAPAAATGVTQTGVYAGAVAGPVLFGLLAEHVSDAAAWRMGGSWMLIAAGVAVWLRFGSGPRMTETTVK
jgi:MFS family permease